MKRSEIRGSSVEALSRIALRSIRATIRRMTISATSIRFDEHTMWVELTDGRTLGVPLAWFPRLLHATPAEREQVELSRDGLHWEAIDEDISVAGLLAGRGAGFRVGEYQPTPEELAGIDRGLRAANEGRFASDQDVEAAFAKFRSP
jgi:hypothetical protein